MNNSAAKVGEIFREAGTAFNKLSEMTLMLQPMDDSPPGGKWSDAEIEMLQGCINRFAIELNKISQHIKNRTMRHLKSLLEKGSGTIQDFSSSPSQQPQPKFLLQQPQLSPHQPHAAQLNTLETESQFVMNEAFMNLFQAFDCQGFPDKDEDEDLNSLFLNFNPSEVNPTPPANIMQDDRIRQQPSSEFEDLKDSSYDKTLQAVPRLISLLDADINNATLKSINPTESCMVNIGTLHAELPIYRCNLDKATGASSNYQELNDNYMSSVSREAHFSLRQAQDTWNYVSSPATNHTTPIESEEKPPGNFSMYNALSFLQSPYTSVQAPPDESALTEKMRLTESQYRPKLDTVSSLLSGSEETLKYIQSKGNPHGNILSSGTFSSFSSNSDHFGSVQVRYDEQEGSSTNKIFNFVLGNSLYSANPEPVTSVQAQTNFSLIRANTKEQALASKGHRTRECRGPRRRREGPVTRASTDPIISPACMTGGRMTRSRCRRACQCEEIIYPVKIKRSRKNAPTKTTPGLRTRAQNKKQSPT